MRRLYKCDTSGGGGCPSVFAEEGAFVVVGDRVDQDPAVAAQLTDMLPGEVAARVPEEVLIGATEEHIGRPIRRDATPIEPLSEAWDQMLRGFDHTAFRLETLQHYGLGYEDEPLSRFLAGEPRPHGHVLGDWIDLVQDACAAGKRMQRVHVVVEPLSPYMRYELAWPYADSVAAGEDIQIIPIGQGEWPVGLPKHDFWLYDSNRVGVLHYDPEGHLYRVEMVRDPVEVVRHSVWRDIAMHQAIPWAEYLNRHPDLQGRLTRPRKEEVGNLSASA
jgi:hypothetical protein